MSRRLLLVVVMALALAAMVFGGIFLATRPGGIAGLPTASPSPTASDSPSDETGSLNPEPSHAATPTTGPTPLAAPDDVIPVGSRVRVLVDGLRIRESTGQDGKLVTRLNAGDVLYVLLGGPSVPPFLADGYAWYPVQFIKGYADWPISPPEGIATFGYVAGHSEAGERFVEVMDPRCPAVFDVESLARMTDWERAACAGDQELTLEGTFGCGVCDSLAQPGTFEPGWLAHYLNPMMPLSPVGHVQEPGVLPIVLAVRPEAERIGPELRGSVLRLVGHFNDPESSDCVIGNQEGLSNDTAAEWYCRERFAVDSWEVIGQDREYPTEP